jgi:hypothetical protein
MTLGGEPSPIKLFVATHERSEDHQKGMQQFIDNRTQHFVVCSFNHFFFHKLWFSWIEFDDFSFYFQETYNNKLMEIDWDDPSTHPDFDSDLCMKAGSFGGPNRNQMYGLSNTTTENLRTACSVSTVGSSQSVSSTQSQEFAAL